MDEIFVEFVTIVASNCYQGEGREEENKDRKKIAIVKNRNHLTISFLEPYRFKEISINIEKSSQIDVRLIHFSRSKEHVYFHRGV